MLIARVSVVFVLFRNTETFQFWHENMQSSIVVQPRLMLLIQFKGPEKIVGIDPIIYCS